MESELPIKVLLVEDDEDDYVMTRELLASSRWGKFELNWVSSYGAGLEAMLSNRHDIYLLDYNLRGRNGLDLIREARRSGCTGPMVVFTGIDNREIDIEAMQAGAVDFLVKSELTRGNLERSIRYALQRSQAEESLRKIASGLAKAQMIAHIGNWEWNVRSNEMTWSDEIYRIFGLYPQAFEASYEAFLRIVHPDDRALVNRKVNESLYDRQGYSFEHRLIIPSGGERIVHQQGEVTYDDSGAPLRMMGTVQDITDRRHSEDALRLMEEKYSKAFHSSPDWGVMTRVADGRYVEVNDAFLQITGYDRDEVIGRTAIELGIWVDPRERVKMLKLLDEKGKVRNLDVAFRIKSGDVRFMVWSAEVIEFNGEAYLIAVARDVTEQRKLERDLIESKAKLQSKHEELSRIFDQVETVKKEWEMTMDHVGDMVILADRNGKIKRCNRALQQFVGLPYTEILGSDWVELLHQYDLITGMIYLQSIELYHEPTGRWFVLNPYPFDDPELPDLSGTVITIHDATELKQISAQLEQAVRELEAKEQR
ncbi:nodulation protein V [Geobacter sp. OR-1]|uniref:PAS domain-containing response regulator n=1 Tax=Geobacter sp. OR-1 TaxID=1266765 RepID=UPI00054296C6|nr:PAS domain S-box protein [Geobacter sp. OR-1]GAM08772.1 nodulation protein V [Geobacter sp. OR-1]